MALYCLQHANYFRLSEYWRIFVSADKQFPASTSFDNVLAVYNFDRNLRALVFDAIGMIEISLRANFAYCLAIKHGPDAHLQERLFS